MKAYTTKPRPESGKYVGNWPFDQPVDLAALDADTAILPFFLGLVHGAISTLKH